MTAPIHLEGIVGWDITPARVREQLADAGDIDVRLHSPGGDVHDGIAIHNLLRDHCRAGHRVAITVTGLAASMATYIAMAADEIRVEDNAVWMIHNPWTFAAGDYRDMRKSGEILDALARVLGNAYATRTGQTINAIRTAMDEETWLYGEDIVSGGWADTLIPAGDGPETPDDAFAIARTAFSSMSKSLQERAATEAAALDRIAAMLPPHQLEPHMSNQKPAANAPEPQPTDNNPAADPTPVEPTAPAEPTSAEPIQEPSAPESTDADIEARIQAAIATERKRVSSIQARCTEVGKPELAKALIDSGASLAACNAAIVDAWVAQGGPEIRQHTTQAAGPDQLTAAVDAHMAQHPGTSRPQAYAAVLAKNPSLYDAHRARGV